MGKKKTKQTNTYEYKAPPNTADVSALREIKAVKNPSIPYEYARIKEQSENSYKNPLGAHTSAATRDAAGRAMSRSLSQSESQANAASEFDVNNQNFNRQAVIAGMTNPQLIQTGGTTTQSGGFWSNLLMSGIGAGAGIGQAAML